MSTPFRNLPSMDMTKQENIQSAAQADAPSGVSGKYIVKVVQASLEQAKTGSVFLTLAFEMPNGKIYRQDAKQIMKPDGSEGFYTAKLRTLFGVTNARDTIGNVRIKVGDFIDGKYVESEVDVPSYTDLIGKQVGVILNFYQKYPDSYGINGYTGNPIPSKLSDAAGYEAAKAEPTTIWMPNYSKQTQPVFDFILFFDPVSEKTFAEMTDDNIETPKAVAEALEKVLAKSHKAVELSTEDWDKLRVKLLRNALKRHGQDFDVNLFRGSVDESPMDSDAFPGDLI